MDDNTPNDTSYQEQLNKLYDLMEKATELMQQRSDALCEREQLIEEQEEAICKHILSINDTLESIKETQSVLAELSDSLQRAAQKVEYNAGIVGELVARLHHASSLPQFDPSFVPHTAPVYFMKMSLHAIPLKQEPLCDDSFPTQDSVFSGFQLSQPAQ